MKIYKFILYIAAGLLLFSCEEYLDKNPESNLSSDNIYSDYDMYKGVVDRIAGLLHNYTFSEYDYGGEMGTYSDECMQSQQGDVILTKVNTGNWQDCNAPGFKWDMGIGVVSDEWGSEEFHIRRWFREIPAEASTGIRIANLCIENIDKLKKYPALNHYVVQNGGDTEVLKNQLLGQAYLFRSWFYFELIRLYGGMPNMQYSFSVNENFDVERPEYWESSKWALDDAEKAIALLPEKWDLPQDQGRVTVSTAKAVKAMILLYQVSPNMQIKRAESLGYTGTAPYAPEDSLKVALAASADALTHALANGYLMYEAADYNKNFCVNTTSDVDKMFSQEALFQAPFSDYIMTQAWGPGAGAEAGNGMYLPWFDGMEWTKYAVPTHNAIDFYETADGYEVGDWHEGKGDAVANSTVWSKDAPYENRDPRMKGDGVIRGHFFVHGQEMYSKPATNANVKLLGTRLDARNGRGHNAADKGKTKNHTGFYIGGKYRWALNNANDGENSDKMRHVQICPFIRVAQLYLDMAELGNEIGGPNYSIPGAPAGAGTPLECINTVRTRVNMPNVHADLYAKDKEDFRDYIRMERARELFFEQHRWQDLRRWRIAHEVLPKGIYVADINGSDIDNVTYSKKIEPSFVRVFENRHYWYPFLQKDMNLFENFEQNPGW